MIIIIVYLYNPPCVLCVPSILHMGRTGPSTHTIHYFLYGVCAHTHVHIHPPSFPPASPFSYRSYPAPWRTDGPQDSRWQLRRIEFCFFGRKKKIIYRGVEGGCRATSNGNQVSDTGQSSPCQGAHPIIVFPPTHYNCPSVNVSLALRVDVRFYSHEIYRPERIKSRKEKQKGGI